MPMRRRGQRICSIYSSRRFAINGFAVVPPHFTARCQPAGTARPYRIKDPEAATSVLRAAEIQVFEPGPRGMRPRTYFTTHGSSACTGFLGHQ
jgi:hypothetical protein